MESALPHARQKIDTLFPPVFYNTGNVQSDEAYQRIGAVLMKVCRKLTARSVDIKQTRQVNSKPVHRKPERVAEHIAGDGHAEHEEVETPVTEMGKPPLLSGNGGGQGRRAQPKPQRQPKYGQKYYRDSEGFMQAVKQAAVGVIFFHARHYQPGDEQADDNECYQPVQNANCERVFHTLNL